MYEELIQQLHPLPNFILDWYNGHDSYSEGNVEDTIIRIIAENPPEDYAKAISANLNWSTYYHLTGIRQNILNWYPFRPDSEILEIGCGLGAITNMLCSRCSHVTAVELSQRRATAALLRCREQSNLDIIVGNLNDIPFTKKFDYITLIGVLEYQGSYTDGANPYMDFLRKIKTLLKPGGKLLIAIENQYGLKYWCGAREDHTGIPFEGLNQYSISSKKVRTFSKDALDGLIRDSGWSHTFFYYPMPDYKLPTVVYSQSQLPSDACMLDIRPYYTPDAATLIADERSLYEDIIRNQVFEFFANSFLVECCDDPQVGEVSFATLASMRLPEYQIATRFYGETVEKYAIHPSGRQHISELLKNEQKLQQQGLHVWQSRLEGEYAVSEYCKFPTWEKHLLDLYASGEISQIYAVFDSLWNEILNSSPVVPWQENILYTFGLDIVPDEEKYGPILETGYIDMIFRNAFYTEDGIYWFDQEWILENVPAKYVMYRALVQFYSTWKQAASNLLSAQELILRYNLSSCWNDFNVLDLLFAKVVIDPTQLAEHRFFETENKQIPVTNIRKILG
ncbi:MAG: class I SAM-dependent methyltransferase [Lachnospiraceae bacterium]|nr:class I SAM-dependent methyltransferase [Lachnospiraceae bacterium]